VGGGARGELGPLRGGQPRHLLGRQHAGHHHHVIHAFHARHVVMRARVGRLLAAHLQPALHHLDLVGL
jgi:hypothetical protein